MWNLFHSYMLHKPNCINSIQRYNTRAWSKDAVPNDDLRVDQEEYKTQLHFEC